MIAKQQHLCYVLRHKARLVPRSFLYVPNSINIESTTASKKGNSDGSMGSKSKTKTMKSYRNNKTEAIQKLKNQKKENALDIISKSVLNAL